MPTRVKLAVRSVRYRLAADCLAQYLENYDGEVRTGQWKERQRDGGETTEHPSVEDSWVEIEMSLGHLPAFMIAVGHPVILDLEKPEIVTRRPADRKLRHQWAIWKGPPRPAYKLTIYDDYVE